MSLQTTRVSQTIRELNALERQIESTLKHVKFCRSISPNIDARELMRLSNDLQKESQEMASVLALLTGQARSLARSISRKPPKQTGIGQFQPWTGGHRIALQNAAKRLPRRMEELRGELHLLKVDADRLVNDPGRWGDAAMPNPVTELTGLLNGLIDLLRRLRERRS